MLEIAFHKKYSVFLLPRLNIEIHLYYLVTPTNKHTLLLLSPLFYIHHITRHPTNIKTNLIKKQKKGTIEVQKNQEKQYNLTNKEKVQNKKNPTYQGFCLL